MNSKFGHDCLASESGKSNHCKRFFFILMYLYCSRCWDLTWETHSVSIQFFGGRHFHFQREVLTQVFGPFSTDIFEKPCSIFRIIHSWSGLTSLSRFFKCRFGNLLLFYTCASYTPLYRSYRKASCEIFPSLFANLATFLEFLVFRDCIIITIKSRFIMLRCNNNFFICVFSSSVFVLHLCTT